MKPDLDISIKDLRRNKTLKILLFRKPFSTLQFFVRMNGKRCPRNSAELICELAADNAGSYGIVWFFLSAMFYAEVKGFARRKSEGYRLTTQAQRPGAPDATIATTTLPPGSLQRMVRTMSHVTADKMKNTTA